MSSAMKPILCRFRAIPGSGLPRPTQSSMASTCRLAVACDAACRVAPLAPPLRAGAAGRRARCRGGSRAQRRPRRSAATSACLVGGTTVATTKSRSITERAFSVPFRSCQRTLSLKSSSAEVGGELLRDMLRHRNRPRPRGGSTFSTPPRFRPGLMPSFSKCTGTDTRMRSPGARRWKSTCSGASVTGMELHVADQRARRRRRSILISYRRDCQPARCSSRSTARGSSAIRVGSCLRAIDDAGHLARPPSRPRRPLTGSRACLGLDRHNIGHGPLLKCKRRPPGVPAWRAV